MEENIAQIIILVGTAITTAGGIATVYFKSNFSALSARVERLERDNAELKTENKSLRVKIEEYQEKVENLLRQLAGKDQDSGVF